MPFAVPFVDRTNVLLERPPVLSDPPPIRPSAAIQTQVNDALDRGETHYTDRPGMLPLREKIAALLKSRFDIAVDARNDIIVTCGVTEARFVAIQQLLQPGQTIAAPAFEDRVFGPSLLRRVVLQDRPAFDTNLLYLTSSTPEEQLRSTLVATPATALVLFEIDEQESHFHPAQVTGFEDRTVTVDNLGEESWRVGYLASPGNFSAALRDFKQALTICSTNLSQWAALAFEEQS